MDLTFKIDTPKKDIQDTLRGKIDNKTKPVGSLGRLEELAIQIGIIQQSLSPKLKQPSILIFAADHGIAAEGVSAYPQEVTKQMVYNFIEGGAAINVFARQNGIDLKIVDAGVKGRFDDTTKGKLVNKKIGEGTRSYTRGPAMTREQCIQAIKNGAECVRDVYQTGCNAIGFGEMGIGNTSSSSIIMHLLTEIPLDECTGRGTGLDEEGLQRKKDMLSQCVRHYSVELTAINILAHFGGFETAMMVGAFLQAAENKMTTLVDGFNATVAWLVASQLYPAIRDYCLFTHQSDEKGHKSVLEHLGVDPILDLNMRLGEGSGVAVAYPLIVSAIRFLNDMASFDNLYSIDESK
jgi:nicotinate-nucleotide--dimethylbenzimidazole phosphoribosyltransferase